jgi:hypothetical protein
MVHLLRSTVYGRLSAVSEGECPSVPGDNSNDPFYLALSSLVGGVVELHIELHKRAVCLFIFTPRTKCFKPCLHMGLVFLLITSLWFILSGLCYPDTSQGTQLRAQTVLKTTRFIERDLMKDVRQPVREIIKTAAAGAGFFAEELLTNLGDDVLSCENVGAGTVSAWVE